MKYLGIDYGAKRIGLAVSDADGKISFPRGTIENNSVCMDAITALVTSEKIESVVVGDTRSLGGAQNPITSDAEKFVAALKGASGLPVEFAFEGWSSIEANRYAPDGHGHDDSAAAAVILQRYLEMHESSVPGRTISNPLESDETDVKE